MERILKILGIAAIIFLLVYWISDISKGCNGSKESNDTEEVIQTSDEANDEVNLEEDIFGEEESKSGDNSTKSKADASKTTVEENVDDYVDYSGEVKETKETSKAKTTNASTNNKVRTKRHKVSGGGGSYLVVAGSYLVKSNANKMKKKLYNLGYNSEIVNFDLSQYYSVLAGRFSSRREANEAVNILKRNGIDCYVHRKKH